MQLKPRNCQEPGGSEILGRIPTKPPVGGWQNQTAEGLNLKNPRVSSSTTPATSYNDYLDPQGNCPRLVSRDSFARTLLVADADGLTGQADFGQGFRLQGSSRSQDRISMRPIRIMNYDAQQKCMPVVTMMMTNDDHVDATSSWHGLVDIGMCMGVAGPVAFKSRSGQKLFTCV